MLAGMKISVWLAALALTVYGQRARPANDQTARLQRAAALITAQDFKGAEAELDAILKAAPQEARALNLLGVVRAQQNRNDEAEELFRRALKTDPRLAGARVNLGLLRLSQERLEEATQEFDAALKIDAARKDARSQLAGTLRRMAAAAREHVVAHHTLPAVLNHIIETVLFARKATV